MASQAEIRRLNEAFFDQIEGNIKEAEETATSYTRKELLENGIARRIIPLETTTNEDLVPAVDHEMPRIIIEMEGESPAAITMPFNANTRNVYIRANRYELRFVEIKTPKFVKNVHELRTWKQDIRTVISDKSIKHIETREDELLLKAANYAMVGPNLIPRTSGVIQHAVFNQTLSREGLLDATKLLPNTPSSLNTQTVLCNNLTIIDVAKFRRDEMGGDFSEEVLRKGVGVIRDMLGFDWVVTIKKGLVPNGTFYFWADPSFLGRFCSLQDATMYIKREGAKVEWYNSELIGMSIGNTNGVARADFAQS